MTRRLQQRCSAVIVSFILRPARGRSVRSLKEVDNTLANRPTYVLHPVRHLISNILVEGSIGLC